jgi:hypothetical protein
MTWLKNQLAIIITLAIVIGAGLVAWGEMKQLSTEIGGKADKDAIMRELDQIHQQLTWIVNKLDRQ